MKRAMLLFAGLASMLWACPSPAETAHNLMEQYRYTAGYDLSAIPELMRGNVNVFIVDNEHANASDAADGRHGESFEYPFSTVNFAVGRCTDSKGDVILVAPRSTEAKAATGVLNTVDVIGVSIIGLGAGANKPTIALSGNAGAVAFSVTAAGVTVRNFLITNAIDATTKAVNVAAADCTLEDIEIRDGADSTECAIGILTTTAADRLTIRRFWYNGFLTGNGTTEAISLVGVDRALIEDCWFRGSFSTSAVQLVTSACSGIVVENCFFENGTTALTKDVVDNAVSKWTATNCFDVVGGYLFAGGSGAALASYAPAAASIGAGDVDAAAIATGAIDADAIATDAIGSAELANSAVNEIEDAVVEAIDANSTSVAAILADTSAADTAGELQTLAGTAAVSTTGITSAPVEKTLADILHKDGGFGFDNTTDSLEALSDKVTTIDDLLDTEIEAIDNYVDTEVAAIMAVTDDLAGISQIGDKIVADMDANSLLVNWTAARAAIVTDLAGISQIGDKIVADMDANSVPLAVLTDLAGISQIGDKIVADMDANSVPLAILTDLAGISQVGDKIVADMDANSILADLQGRSQLGDKVQADMDANSLLQYWTEVRALIITDLAGISQIGDKIVADMDANSVPLAILTDLAGISQVGDKVQADMDVNSVLYWQPRVSTVSADEVTQDLFAVAGGPIEILSLTGHVDVLIGANVTTCKIWSDATAGAAFDKDYSTAVAITDDAAGTTYVFTSANPSVLTALTGGAAGGSTNFDKTWWCPIGMIEQEMSADPGGAVGDHVTWYMVWRPLAAGVTVTAQ